MTVCNAITTTGMACQTPVNGGGRCARHAPGAPTAVKGPRCRVCFKPVRSDGAICRDHAKPPLSRHAVMEALAELRGQLDGMQKTIDAIERMVRGT